MSVIEAMARAADAEVWGSDPDDVDSALRGMRAALSEARKMGWKLVPVEPTEEMNNAGNGEIEITLMDPRNDVQIDEADPAKIYRAMIAASPSIEENKP